MILGALFTLFVVSNNYIDYVLGDVLTKNRKIFTLLGFLAVLLYIVYVPKEAIAKFSGLCFVFILFTVCLLFVFSIDNFNPNNSDNLIKGKLSSVLAQTFVYIKKAFIYTVILPVFIKLSYQDKNFKRDILSILIGGALLSVCLISAVLTFSVNTASSIDFAYPMSISVVSIGELFTRMDGYAYFIFFFSGIIKTAVCTKTVKLILDRIDLKNSQKITAFFVTLTLIFSYII